MKQEAEKQLGVETTLGGMLEKAIVFQLHNKIKEVQEFKTFQQKRFAEWFAENEAKARKKWKTEKRIQKYLTTLSAHYENELKYFDYQESNIRLVIEKIMTGESHSALRWLSMMATTRLIDIDWWQAGGPADDMNYDYDADLFVHSQLSHIFLAPELHYGKSATRDIKLDMILNEKEEK